MTDSVASRRTPGSLILRLRDNRDENAWKTFVQLYTPLIYGLARREGLQEADAADLTQEVLNEVIRSIQNFELDHSKGRFRDWLGVIIRRRIWAFRKNVRDLSLINAAALSGIDDDGTTDPGWDAEFYRYVLDKALERIQSEFEPNTWRAFLCTWVNDENPTNVGQSLGMSVSAVYMAKSRVLKRLEAEILEIAEDLPELHGLWE